MRSSRASVTTHQLTRRHVAAVLNHQLHIPLAVSTEMTALYCENLMTAHKVSHTATWVRLLYSKMRVIQEILKNFTQNCQFFIVYCFCIVFLLFTGIVL